MPKETTIEDLKSSKFWIAPWNHLTQEEKSYILLQAYQRRILKSEEVETFMSTGTNRTRLNIAFPFITYLALSKTLPVLFRSSFLSISRERRVARVLGLTMSSWLAFQYLNPLYLAHLREKQDLLWLVYERTGNKIMKLNDILPRGMTESEIVRQMKQSHSRFNSRFSDYLYASEDKSLPLVDPTEFSKILARPKIFH